MSKMTIEVEIEQVEAIVRQDLESMLDILRSDLERVQENRKGYVFDMDWKKDSKQLQKHIKSFERVLRYYGGEL